MPYFFYPIIVIILFTLVYILIKTGKINFFENQIKNKKNTEYILISFIIGIFILGVLIPTITGCDTFGGMRHTNRPPTVFCTRNGIFPTELNYIISFWGKKIVSLLLVLFLIYKIRR
mgnify:CR=1 FL=1